MAKVSFNNKGQAFFSSLKASVDQYFTQNNLKKTGNWKLYLKTMILIPLSSAIYIFLLVGTYSALVGILLTLVLGLGLVAIAFNVMHDSCHGSYSSKKWVNDLFSYTMNALGSNAYMWKIKHNVIHHTYTNVDGIDDDIAKSPVLRLCPSQKWVPAHKYQFVYMFFLYSLSTILWAWVTDFITYVSRKMVVTEMKMNFKEHFLFWLTKLLYFGFYALLPIVLLGWQTWLIGYLILNVTMGITLSMVFQLAHIVEKTEFEEAGEKPRQLDTEWAIHELRTTANFAPKNKIVTWFAGGLNFQVEHHLFPKISHVHYKELSKIVQDHCDRFGIPYHSYPKMRQAVLSHIKVMKQLGKKEAA
ncbi:MAG TPA: acyl-CoA desaturase [Flavisolibacter sp.]|jgi:linoleoyl-CoA desaturase|nr:acyl-CoA desaturase [Flavisolibacter sp.]